MLNVFNPNILLTMACLGDEPVVMHSYIIDREDKRVRLLHSASDFRSLSTSQERAIIGRANRFLHYSDIIYFKNNGFFIYDFGGISLDKNDAEQLKISEFKRGFGGVLVEESNFLSWPLIFLAAIRLQLHKFITRIR